MEKVYELGALGSHKAMATNLHSVLFGFWNNLASHLERSALNRRTTMLLRPIVQPALPTGCRYLSGSMEAGAVPDCPKNPNPCEKCGLVK